MDIHQLQLFLAVMESPSMTRAAEKVCLSPGAVSLQLQMHGPRFGAFNTGQFDFSARHDDPPRLRQSSRVGGLLMNCRPTSSSA